MTFKEYFDTVTFPYDPVANTDSHIPSELLSSFTETLLTLDEFEGVTKISIIDTPCHSGLNVQTYKLQPGDRFYGECYLYSILRSPKLYFRDIPLLGVKDGFAISPVIYDTNTFEPFRSILLRYSPEKQYGVSEQEYRQLLHEKLDHIIDNSEEYLLHGERYYMIRAYFIN